MTQDEITEFISRVDYCKSMIEDCETEDLSVVVENALTESLAIMEEIIAIYASDSIYNRREQIFRQMLEDEAELDAMELMDNETETKDKEEGGLL